MVFCTWGEVSLCRKTISYYQHQLIPTNGMQRKRRTGVPLAKDQASLIPSIFFLCQGLSLVSTTIVKRMSTLIPSFFFLCSFLHCTPSLLYLLLSWCDRETCWVILLKRHIFIGQTLNILIFTVITSYVLHVHFILPQPRNIERL